MLGNDCRGGKGKAEDGSKYCLPIIALGCLYNCGAAVPCILIPIDKRQHRFQHLGTPDSCTQNGDTTSVMHANSQPRLFLGGGGGRGMCTSVLQVAKCLAKPAHASGGKLPMMEAEWSREGAKLPFTSTLISEHKTHWGAFPSLPQPSPSAAETGGSDVLTTVWL